MICHLTVAHLCRKIAARLSAAAAIQHVSQTASNRENADMNGFSKRMPPAGSSRSHPQRLGKVTRLDGSVVPGLGWDETSEQIIQLPAHRSPWMTMLRWLFNLVLAAGILLIGWVVVAAMIANADDRHPERSVGLSSHRLQLGSNAA